MKLTRKSFHLFLPSFSGWNAGFLEVEWCRGKEMGLGLGDKICVKVGGEEEEVNGSPNLA